MCWSRLWSGREVRYSQHRQRVPYTMFSFGFGLWCSDNYVVKSEPVFVDFQGAQKSIPSLARRYETLFLGIDALWHTWTMAAWWRDLVRVTDDVLLKILTQWEKSWTEAGVLVRKLSQLTPLGYAKQTNPGYFIKLCGSSCELAGCVHRPIVDSEATTAGWGQTKRDSAIP